MHNFRVPKKKRLFLKRIFLEMETETGTKGRFHYLCLKANSIKQCQIFIGVKMFQIDYLGVKWIVKLSRAKDSVFSF